MHKEDIPFIVLIAAFVFVLVAIEIDRRKTVDIQRRLTIVELQCLNQ